MPSAESAKAASGSAMLLCLLLGGRSKEGDEEEGGGGGELSKLTGPEGKKESILGPIEAPETWWGEVEAAGMMVRFIWSELIGKWSILDLAFGIKYLMRRRGNLQVASVYAGSDCVQVKGHKIMAQLVHMLSLLNLCMLFSKKPFRVFLRCADYSQEDVLLHVSKAGILKPAFTILCDRSSNCFLLVIRGMHSLKDLLTALNGAVVPFHHSFLHEDGVNRSVRGYAHCGMVAAARWIAKCATPFLLKAFNNYPDYNIKIVGNSLGGGTAALLTYILRERKEFSSSTCIAFAPAACMTWDIAESGKDFITTIINGSDQVPSCSVTSINYLRSEVSSSSWLSDLWVQVLHSRFLSVVNCFTSPLGTNLEPISPTTAEEDAATSLHHALNKTQQQDKVSLVVERINTEILVNGLDFGCSSTSDQEKEAEGKKLIHMFRVTAVSTTEESTPLDAVETLQFYPPGKIMHMFATPGSDSSPGENLTGTESIGIYETRRDLYSKIRLSKRMIKDHYMPMYRKTMEQLIDSIGKGEDSCTGMLL